jgi:hypothetical protein
MQGNEQRAVAEKEKERVEEKERIHGLETRLIPWLCHRKFV